MPAICPNPMAQVLVDSAQPAHAILPVPDPKNPIDQVEVELIDACELAQFVLNQRPLGRAVHLRNAEATEPGAGYGIYRCSHCGRAVACFVGVTADIL